MCIAIYIPVGEDVTDEALETSFIHNPHGCGLAYISKAKKKVVIYHDMKFERFVKRFRKLQTNNPESPFFVHLRKKTHGETTMKNCHPFKIDDDHIFMHNDTIYPEVPTDKDGKVSDTVNFNENILKKLPEGWTESEGIKEMLQHYVGRSRIAVMNSKGEVTLFNEFKPGAHGNAHWHEGVWYSNDYYKTLPFVAHNHTTSTHTTGFTKKVVGLDDLDFVPEGASFVNGKGFAARWNVEETCLEAWDTHESQWRFWDSSIEWFRKGTSNRSYVSNDGYARHFGKEMCDSCREMVFWYDLDEYQDEWKNSHTLCEECATSYNKVGMKLQMITYRTQQRQLN
jgi:hypothetical protein